MAIGVNMICAKDDRRSERKHYAVPRLPTKFSAREMMENTQPATNRPKLYAYLGVYPGCLLAFTTPVKAA